MNETKEALELFDDVDFISVLTLDPDEQMRVLPMVKHLEIMGMVTNLQAREATVPLISSLTELGKKMRDQIKG